MADQEGEPPSTSAPLSDPSPPALLAAVAATFLARSDDLMLLLDRDGTITWASPSCEHFCGVTAERMVDVACVDFIHPDHGDRVTSAIRNVAEAGGNLPVTAHMIGPGQATWVELVLTNLPDEPDANGIVAHLRDITERRRTEAELQFQSSMLAAVGQAITARDLDGIVIHWNPAAAALFGFTAEEMLGRRIGDLMSPAPGHEDRAREAGQAHHEARSWSGMVVMDTKDGRTVQVQTTSAPVFDRDGNHLGTVTASHDLTEILDEQRRSEEDRRRLVDAQASAHLGSFELDLATGDFLGSDEFWRIIGRPPSNLGALEHVHPDDLPRFTAAFFDARDGDNDVSCTHRIVRPDGAIRWVITRSSQFNSTDTVVLAGTVLDITEQHEAEMALVHQATHDPLTDLLHNRAFVDRLAAMLALDPDTVGDVALIVLDLDHFKSVNDRVGHIDADDLLRQLGHRIGAAAPDAVVGRLGGDEFVICLDHLGGRDDVQQLLVDLWRAIRLPVEVRGTELSLDASIGIAVAGPERRPEELLRNADLAMWEAKRMGRGRAEYFDEALAEKDRRRSLLLDDLRSALDRHEVDTHFQPEFDLASGALFGFEALARWRHPQLGQIGPDEFIPLAEESGLIGALGRQMLSNTGACLARWNQLTVDFLKIDQSFVADIGRTPEDDVIITTMTTLARSVGVGIIAEGIETEEQRSFLTALGCQYGQGWLWSPALDEAGATSWIASGAPAPARPR